MLKNIIKTSIAISLCLVLLTNCKGKCNPRGVSYKASMPVEEVKIIEEIEIDEIKIPVEKPIKKHIKKPKHKKIKHDTFCSKKIKKHKQKNKIAKHKMKKKHQVRKSKPAVEGVEIIAVEVAQ